MQAVIFSTHLEQIGVLLSHRLLAWTQALQFFRLEAGMLATAVV